MTEGKVLTGFSKPYVALYSAEGTTITYSSGQLLARGVDVNISPEASEDNIFYANNAQAENDSGMLTGGTVDLTVDGLLTASERLIMGLPAAADSWIVYDDDQAIPDCGLGFIARYMSGGVTTYVPFLLRKVRFSQIETSAATQEDEIDWQTQTLSATLMRSDDAKHSWKWMGEDQTTEAAAEALIKTALGIQ